MVASNSSKCFVNILEHDSLFFFNNGFYSPFFWRNKTGYPANARVPRRSTLYETPRVRCGPPCLAKHTLRRSKAKE